MSDLLINGLELSGSVLGRSGEDWLWHGVVNVFVTLVWVDILDIFIKLNIRVLLGVLTGAGWKRPVGVGVAGRTGRRSGDGAGDFGLVGVALITALCLLVLLIRAL
jgi:hypothetical protein